MNLLKPTFLANFKDWCRQHTLAVIDDIFRWSGLERQAIDPPEFTTQRKERAAEYCRSVDLGSPESVRRLLAAVETALGLAAVQVEAKAELRNLCLAEGLKVEGDGVTWPGDPGAADSPALPPTTEHVMPFDVVKGTRTYLEQIVNQANGCYEKGWYDACSVMVRKLVEVLIIAVYEKKGEAEAVKKDGNFLMLAGLVDDILARTAWNLGRETKTALPLLKSLGDRSAHNRHYMALKADVDRVLQGLRVAVEELLHHAGLVK
jgi:hypothetical protein